MRGSPSLALEKAMRMRMRIAELHESSPLTDAAHQVPAFGYLP